MRCITLPDGSDVSSADSDIEQRLSDVLGRKVSFVAGSDDWPMLEEVWIEEKTLQKIDRLIKQGQPAHTIETPVFDFPLARAK